MMRFLVPFVLAAFVAGGVARAADPELKTEDDKTVYALGLVIAKQLAPFHLTPAEIEMLKAGMADGISGKAAKVDLETYGPKIQPFGMQRHTAALAAALPEEKKKGKEYLDKIAANSKVKKVEAGILVETITEGTGASPVPNDTIKVNYSGKTIDGKEFDSSKKGGGPATFKLDSNVIKCWNQAFPFVKVGGKAKIYCSSDSAYGDQGRGANIPPGATLIFEVELVDIIK